MAVRLAATSFTCAGIGKAHLAKRGDSHEALVAAGGVLDGLDDERQHLAYVHAQTGAGHARQLPSRGKHARHNAALAATFTQ